MEQTVQFYMVKKLIKIDTREFEGGIVSRPTHTLLSQVFLSFSLIFFFVNLQKLKTKQKKK